VYSLLRNNPKEVNYKIYLMHVNTAEWEKVITRSYEIKLERKGKKYRPYRRK